MEPGQAQVKTDKVVNKATNEQFSVSTSAYKTWIRGVEVKRTPAPTTKGQNLK